eukprot:TRINITY_DN35762_c0_g1_i4.p1 TRINITY_DN35762_c0_g1~~TRINITY_DN35762_c0_g1_i4.p1  ORF type:complete len:350 (+),score=35.18 TRINITY_DN35762_c0_g1_i4:93-1142(+)
MARVHPELSSRWQTWSELRDASDIPDDHLFLGVTERTILKFKDMLRFPASYSRQAYFDRRDAEKDRIDWITPAYGPDLTGYDFVHCLRDWHENNDITDVSSAEYLQAEGDRGVDYPIIFLSHVQSEPLEATLRVTKSVFWREAQKRYGEVPFWLDYFVLRQCTRDFDPEHIALVIKAISWTVATEDDDETYFSRLFCVFELAATTPFADESKSTSMRLSVLPSRRKHMLETRRFVKFTALVLLFCLFLILLALRRFVNKQALTLLDWGGMLCLAGFGSCLAAGLSVAAFNPKSAGRGSLHDIDDHGVWKSLDTANAETRDPDDKSRITEVTTVPFVVTPVFAQAQPLPV